MTLSKRAFYTLFTIIIVEGYIVLSSELLAIRVTIPYIGSGTDMVSIIIAAVLLPLSFGYYFGGQFKPHKNIFGQTVTIRARLSTNILIAAFILLFGISFIPLRAFMETLLGHGITHRSLIAAIYAALFIVTPVFLLGQTIPLVSNYFRRENLSQITGKILFFSTIGSFLGATFATLVLMATIGVHYTAAINFALLALLFFLLGRRRHIALWGIMLSIMVAGITLNSGAALKKLNILNNNQYNVITIYKNAHSPQRVISLNGNSDSSYNPVTKEKHDYIDYIEKEFVYSRWTDAPPMDVLVIGAGGFTLGLDDDVNTYHYVDIDPDLQDVVEKHFLDRPLNKNQIFHPMSAESFIIQGDTSFDLIVLDAYQGSLTIPENLITQDFFMRAKKRLKPEGILLANFVQNPAFGSAFDRNLDATFRSVFPTVTRQVIGDYNGWNTRQLQNVLFIYHSRGDEGMRKIYTEDRNTSYYDTPKSRAP